MISANPREQCARLFDGSGLGWRCTRPIGHQGQHCSSSLMPLGDILTRYDDWTSRTSPEELRRLERHWSPNVPSIGSRDMGGDLR